MCSACRPNCDSFRTALAINHQTNWNVRSERLDELFKMYLHGAPALLVQTIEPVDGLPSSLFIERRLEHGKRLRRMSHSAGRVDTRSDAEGHVARIRLGWIGAGAFEQLLQSFVSDRGSSARPSLARVRVACKRGTESAIESIAAYGLHPDSRRSTFASFQPARRASAHASIAARPAPQNLSDQAAVVSACSWIRW